MNKLELAMIKNIATDHPVSLRVLEHCQVLRRSFSGDGSETYFAPIATPLLSDSDCLKTPDIFVMDGLELSGELHLDNGVPQFLKINCLNWSGWDGAFSSFTIKN